MQFILFLILLCLSYLLGSVCTAVIVCKVCHLPDPRTEGSKNPGATNVLRISDKKYAAIVLISDVLKGLIPLLIGQFFGLNGFFLGCLALAAVLGHIFPVFFEFKGGKGVATALGTLLGLNITLGLFVCVIWLVVAKMSRYSSLASIVSIAATPLLLLFTTTRGAFIPFCVMAACILYKHRHNIERLKSKTETKISF